MSQKIVYQFLLFRERYWQRSVYRPAEPEVCIKIKNIKLNKEMYMSKVSYFRELKGDYFDYT